MVPLCVSLGVSVFSCFFFGFCGPAAGVCPSEECLLGGPFCSPAAGVFPSVECLFGGPFCGPAAGVFPSVECLFFRSFLRTCCRYILYWLIPFASCIHDKSSQFQGATSSESEPRMQERNGNDQGTERVLEPKLFVQISGQRGHAFLGLRFGIRVYGKLREC